MRLLVVHRERSHASLVGSALKRLGHRGTPCAPDEALEQVASLAYDAVIADCDSLPVVLLARLRDADIPLALSGSIDPLFAANVSTTLLPRVWTVADLKRVVEDLEREARRFASGSSPAIEFDVEDDGRVAATADDADSERGESTDPDLPAVPQRAAPPSVTVACVRWSDAVRLCRELEAGRRRITVRGPSDLGGAPYVTVLLRLPDELVLAMSGRVVASALTDGVRFATQIELDEVSPGRLRQVIPAGGG